MKLNKAAIDSYGRHLLGAVVSAIAAISTLTGQSPVDFTSGDWWAAQTATAQASTGLRAAPPGTRKGVERWG